ncbi:MAG: peptide chain release factor N(5)-glutamine methyltransferase [Paracoccaceae bacterium]
MSPPRPTTVTEALRAAIPRLRAAGVDDPARDARALMAHAAGLTPDRLTLHLSDPLTDPQAAAFAAHVAARERRQPVAQIIGQRLFWGRSFCVTPDVLDPRPETEILIDHALSRPFSRVLDLGTGSGAILITLLAESPDATGLGADLSAEALAVARGNARLLGVMGRAEFLRSDWFDAIPGRFDLIVSNPPYIAEEEMASLSPEVRDWEPHLALTPGGDGLDAYRAIAAGAGAHLAPGGRLMVEVGPTQGDAVAALLSAAGLENPRILPDLDGRPRVVAADCRRG